MKGIAIYLVVLGHLCSGYCPLATKLINVCHMPTFFFISGLFFAKSFDKRPGLLFVREKVKTLLIPYLIWSGVSFLFNALLLIFQGNTSLVFDVFLQIFIKARSVWFLPALFLAFGITGGIKGATKNKRLFWIVSILICFIAFFTCNTDVFRIYKFRWLYPFFLLGIFVSERGFFFDRLAKMKERKYFLQMFIALLAVTVYSAGVSLGFSDDCFSGFFGERWELEQMGVYIWGMLLGFLGMICIIEISVMISKMRAIQNVIGLIGKCSMDIYVIHMLFIKAMTMLLLKIPQDSFLLSMYSLSLYAGIIVAVILFFDLLVFRKSKWFRISIGART